MTQIAFAGVGMDFGATKLFSDVIFTVAPGERWGIVGRNGTGKTTLLNALAATIPDTDRIALIEETSEILLEKPNYVRFEARMGARRATTGISTKDHNPPGLGDDFRVGITNLAEAREGAR